MQKKYKKRYAANVTIKNNTHDTYIEVRMTWKEAEFGEKGINKLRETIKSPNVVLIVETFFVQ